MRKLSKEVRNRLMMSNPKRKGVSQHNIYTGKLIKTYHSLKEAMRETGIHRTSIRMVCDGIYTRAGLYTWKYTTASDKEIKSNLI